MSYDFCTTGAAFWPWHGKESPALPFWPSTPLMAAERLSLNVDSGSHTMATAPTDSEIQEYIFEYIRQSGRNPRAGEIAADITQPQIYVDKQHGVRAAEYEKAINGLIKDGFLEYNGGKFLKMTEKGFARL